MTELRSVEKSAMVDLTLEDLRQMRPRVVNQNAYIDLLLSWASCAAAEVVRLEEETDPLAVAVRVLNDHDMQEEAERLQKRAARPDRDES